MWELNNGSYYKWQDTRGEHKDLVASLIHHGPEDGVNPHKWSVQIHPVDGGIVVVGYIRELHFDEDVAQALADLALAQNQTYDWWMVNGAKWWTEHNVNSISLR